VVRLAGESPFTNPA